LPLRFSKSDDPAIEKNYRAHYVSPALSQRKQQSLQEKLNRAPQLVVYEILGTAQCSECGVEMEQGSLFFKEAKSPLCPYGDYAVKSASGRTSRVAIRGLSLFENYCSCPDFAINTLGTCKHVEAVLLRLRKRHQKTLESAKYKRARASISLQYGNTVEVRLRLPALPSRALRAIAADHFDANGLLHREHYRRFGEVLEALRNADNDAVVYSDALEYIDRENELTEGLELERKLLGKLKRGQNPTAGLLKTNLLPYQARGAVFAACRGRAVLADDMGLGKTVQALAMTELLRQGRGIERVPGERARFGQASVEGGNREVHSSFRSGDRWLIPAPQDHACDSGILQPHEL
jgi:hypothetical protein